MAAPVITAISLCAGVGMLDLGVGLAFEHLGFDFRTVAYAEWEAPAASQLVALMEAGALEPAPVWCGDFRRLGASRFLGAVDCIVAGFPCQDISIAGRRAGLDGKRSGLFFDILDLADDCGAWLLALENVAGIATATASVVDEAEGELDERAAARVVGELADRGWDSEWLTLSASDVGASHGRARWFCFAWRRRNGDVAHAERAERGPVSLCGLGCIEGNDRGRREADGGTGVAEEVLGNPASARLPQPGQPGQPELPAQAARWLHDRPELAILGVGLAHAEGDGWHEGRAESSGEQGRPDAAECGGAVADATDHHGRRGISAAQAGTGAGCGRRGSSGGGAELADAGEPRLPLTQQHEPGSAGGGA